MPEENLPALIEIRPGIYRHYKNLMYEVLATARHSETLEAMTLYRALYGERALWVRPATMFGEEVVVAGVRQPRFTWVGETGATAD
ncbi:MAG: DUF1653 domain-containing protein [Hylemonella sp.]|nr:DUF1653 domain-containing protein [Hylemonella sp.]MDH5709161.1 DUF1653 domain-containing protein [Hylemonella sp.]